MASYLYVDGDPTLKSDPSGRSSSWFERNAGSINAWVSPIAGGLLDIADGPTWLGDALGEAITQIHQDAAAHTPAYKVPYRAAASGAKGLAYGAVGAGIVAIAAAPFTGGVSLLALAGAGAFTGAVISAVADPVVSPATQRLADKWANLPKKSPPMKKTQKIKKRGR
ncbi:MAG: hypothetical protein HY092_03740 [Candidatus Kerfeldbacteria bacterium]|nr:hypothetical protein [Candidatus Kerfeldbacteria bacterium]